AERVDHDDKVERPRQRAQESGVLDVAQDEGESGMGFARLGDHAGAEIHTDPERGLEGGKKIASAASELEHTRAFRDEKLQIEEVLVVEEHRARKPLAALARAR